MAPTRTGHEPDRAQCPRGRVEDFRGILRAAGVFAPCHPHPSIGRHVAVWPTRAAAISPATQNLAVSFSYVRCPFLKQRAGHVQNCEGCRGTEGRKARRQHGGTPCQVLCKNNCRETTLNGLLTRCGTSILRSMISEIGSRRWRLRLFLGALEPGALPRALPQADMVRPLARVIPSDGRRGQCS